MNILKRKEMVAKILTRKDSGATACYCLDHDDARILGWDGLDISLRNAEHLDGIINLKERKEFARKMTLDIDHSFKVQAALCPLVEKPVGHIPISFCKEDEPVLTDKLMLEIALKYMQMMGIINTQYMIVRHYKKGGNPHFHIFYNRVDNNGRRISSDYNYLKNAEVCKQIKQEYKLTFSKGKNQINVQALHGEKKAIELCRRIVSAVLPHCYNWNDLSRRLRERNIYFAFSYKEGTQKVKGIYFVCGFEGQRYSFGGSRMDRSLSYHAIEHTLDNNKTVAEKVAESLAEGLLAISGGSKSQGRDLTAEELEAERRRNMFNKPKGRKI